MAAKATERVTQGFAGSLCWAKPGVHTAVPGNTAQRPYVQYVARKWKNLCCRSSPVFLGDRLLVSMGVWPSCTGHLCPCVLCLLLHMVDHPLGGMYKYSLAARWYSSSTPAMGNTLSAPNKTKRVPQVPSAPHPLHKTLREAKGMGSESRFICTHQPNRVLLACGLVCHFVCLPRRCRIYATALRRV